MDRQTTIDQLKKADLIRILPEETIGEMADSCRKIDFKADQILFEAGDSGQSMYFVLSGGLLVYRGNKVIAMRGPGQYIGEMALIEQKPRASVKAVVETRCVEVNENQFIKIFASRPQTLMEILKTLSSRTRSDLDALEQDHQKLVAQEKISNRLNHILDFTNTILKNFHSLN